MARQCSRSGTSVVGLGLYLLILHKAELLYSRPTRESAPPPPLPFCFVLARGENDLASQDGTVLRGSGKLYFCQV